jgi:tol-pal system protein YbgF
MQRARGLGRRRRAGIIAAVGLAAATSGCVTVAEFRKLEDRVVRIERGGSGKVPREAVANAAAEIDVLRSELEVLRGRLEVAEKIAADASVDARKARQGLAVQQVPPPPEPGPEAAPLSEEVRAYRDAYAAWRADQHQACIDKFGAFLQSYPESAEADDAMFWMADCLFKSGDYKYAVLRFDDVVNKYPEGDKAPDALFRQGEALLELGPSYHGAAIKAFERLLSEYPDSALVDQARRRLEVARAG